VVLLDHALERKLSLIEVLLHIEAGHLDLIFQLLRCNQLVEVNLEQPFVILLHVADSLDGVFELFYMQFEVTFHLQNVCQSLGPFSHYRLKIPFFCITVDLLAPYALFAHALLVVAL